MMPTRLVYKTEKVGFDSGESSDGSFSRNHNRQHQPKALLGQQGYGEIGVENNRGG